MYRMLFALLALAHIANSQTATCRTALYHLDSSCVSRLYNGDITVCPLSGTCGYQLYNTLEACASSFNSDYSIQQFLTAYIRGCFVSSYCATAYIAVLGNTECQNALRTDDPDIFCTGTCKALTEDYIEECTGSYDEATTAKQEFNDQCDGSTMLQASAVITLLLVTLSTLIF